MKKGVVWLLLLSLVVCFAGCKGTKLTDNSSSDAFPSSYTTSYTAEPTPSEGDASSKNGVTSGNDKTVASTAEISSTATPPSSQRSTSSERVQISVGTPHVNAGDTYYHCYQYLNSRQKEFYDKIAAAVIDMTVGRVTLGEGTAGDVATAFISVRSDHPEFFWLSSEYVIETSSDGTVNIILESTDGKVTYNCTRTERDSMQAKLDERVNEIIASIPQNATAFEIECLLHDILADGIEYDLTHPMRLTSYAALVEGRAVCEGYARAMQLLLGKMSIPCILVNGIADGQGHMWNMVKLENEWYHLDVTWDDLRDCDFTVHGFFNMNDARVRAERTVDKDISALSETELTGGVSCNVSLPAANATALFYPSVYGFVLDDNVERSVSVIKEKLSDAVAAKATFCEFYVASADVEIEAKYNLSHCIREINRTTAKRFNVTSTVRADKTVVLIIKYEGE